MREGVVVLVPVLNRPANVRPLLDSIRATTPEPYRVLFLCDPGDWAEHDAIALAEGWMLSPGGGYAAKIRAGVEATDEPLIFLGADDLTFLPGWLDAARGAMRNGVQVVGVNDLIPRRPGREGHATHFLMTRAAATRPTMDGEPGPLSQAYSHSFVDDELIATATKRGMYAYEPRARVRHSHPMAGGEDDDTYRLGRAQFRQDRKLFLRRSRLWT